MVGIAVKTFGVSDFSRLAVTDWLLRRRRLWFLALMTATPKTNTRSRKQNIYTNESHLKVNRRFYEPQK